MNQYFLSAAILLAVYGVVTAGEGKEGRKGGRGMMMMHGMTNSIVCGRTEQMACFEKMSNFAAIKEAVLKVTIEDGVKQKMCPKPEEIKPIHEANKKIFESVKGFMKEKKDKEEMKPVFECLKKLHPGKAEPEE